ncbi:unnamed protein product [Scytosiphon promiscuus]
MVPTPRTSFMDDHDDEDDPGHHEESGFSPQSAFSCGTSEGSRIWCNRTDTMGVVMATMALTALAYGEFVVVWVVFFTGNFVVANAIIYTFLTVMAVWCHLKTMLSEPGVVPRAALPLRDESEDGAVAANHTLCGRCESYKPTRAHHCRLCGRCVVRMDHHCPWMNNCVGVANQKYFILFLFYALAVTGYAVGLVLYHFIQCVAESYCDDYSTLTANLIRAVLIIAAAAMIFTLSMLMNQFHGVITGLGTVDRMQRRKKEGRIRGGVEDFRPMKWSDIFGEGNKLMWLFPTDPYFRKAQRERILGFREPPAARQHDYEEV